MEGYCHYTQLVVWCIESDVVLSQNPFCRVKLLTILTKLDKLINQHFTENSQEDKYLFLMVITLIYH